jgi:hypothetical protein
VQLTDEHDRYAHGSGAGDELTDAMHLAGFMARSAESRCDFGFVLRGTVTSWRRTSSSMSWPPRCG